MDVILGILREVPVVDVADVDDVEPAGRDVGRHQDRKITRLEGAERPEPLALVEVTGERAGGVPVPRETLHEPMGFLPCVDEDEHARALLRAEQPEQEPELLVVPDVVEHLLDPVDRDLRRIVHELVGELEHSKGQRGREQEGLPGLGRGQPAENPADVGDEPHVEHPVGLVEHENLDAGRRPDALLEVVDEAAWRPDQEIDGAAQGLALLRVVHAAEHDVRVEPGELPEQPRVRLDLDRELPRRGDDEGARRRRSPACRGRRPEEPRERCDQERRRLARPGLRLPRHVLAAKGHRQRRFLDRRRDAEPGGADALQDGTHEVELGELHPRLGACEKIAAARSGRRGPLPVGFCISHRLLASRSRCSTPGAGFARASSPGEVREGRYAPLPLILGALGRPNIRAAMIPTS